jgi:hypothetical protein
MQYLGGGAHVDQHRPRAFWSRLQEEDNETQIAWEDSGSACLDNNCIVDGCLIV